jgi:hypothetical protein
MKTKVFLLAIFAGFVLSSNAQEFNSQIGSSKEAGYKTDFKKNKFGDNWFISIAGSKVKAICEICIIILIT